MPINLPILLTWLRIVLIPLVVGVFFLPDAWMSGAEKNVTATVVFVVAALTDWLDGWLARRWKQTSSFGAFLDPVADKLMVTAALMILLQLSRINALVALVIVGREIAISALREWMAKLGASNSVAVHWLGKIKTIAQMVAIPMLLYDNFFVFFDSHYVGTRLIWIAALLTVWSMAYYMRKAYPRILARTRTPKRGRRLARRVPHVKPPPQ
ncbi:MAG: CDP-diacylglycerol--glycerol-3-phosphate 3-phosphatidyltransferase [Burkholderiaceae bacterium]